MINYIGSIPLFLILCIISIIGCAHHSKSKQQDLNSSPLTFAQYEIDTNSAKHQTVLTGFFLNNTTTDLAVLNSNDNETCSLQIYELSHGNWSSTINTNLRPEVLFVDTANLGGKDRLITYEHGRFNWFDPVLAAEKPLIDIPFDYKASSTNEIQHIDITRDINHDGLDDIVCPSFDGFWIAIQLNNGTFTDPVQFGPSEPFLEYTPIEHHQSYQKVGMTSETIPWYLSRIHEMDYNRDGQSDVVFWNKDHFEIHYQNDEGQFDQTAIPATTEAPIDSDGVYSLQFGLNSKNLIFQLIGVGKKTKQTVLHSFQDMNNDNVTDLITQTAEGKGAISLRNWYNVHFGTPTADGVTFNHEVDMTLQPRKNARGKSPLGYSLGWMQDLDGDGHTDFIFGRVNTGVIGFFSAILANSIAINIEYYRIENDVFPNKPNGSLRAFPDLEFFGKRGPFFPTVLLGDVNGDGRIDLVVGENRDELHIYKGEAGRDFFSPTPQTLSVDVPANENDTKVIDLNTDNKQDILIHHRSSTESNRVIVLIAE